MRAPVFVILLLLAPWVVQAQEYSYVNYNIKDGLAGSVVYHIVQDHDGFIWFATETGLSRFDGTRFKNFTTEDGLPDNEVIRLLVDSKNRVWIIPFSTSLCYYRNGEIHHAGNDSLIRNIAVKDQVISMVEDHKGRLIITEKGQVTAVGPDNTVMRFKNKYTGIRPLDYYDICGLDFDGSLLVSAAYFEEMKMYKESGDSLIFYSQSADTIVFQSKSIIDSRVRVIVTPKFMRIITREAQHSIPTPRSLISTSLVNDSILSIATSAETITYNFVKKQKERLYFTGKNISHIFEDREGNLWFSTLGEGVYRLASSRFQTWKFVASGTFLAVHALKKTGGTLWVGTDHFKLWQLNTSNNQMREEPLNDGRRHGRITAIEQLSDGTLLFGTESGLHYRHRGTLKTIGAELTLKSLHVSNDTLVLGNTLAVDYARGKTFIDRILFEGRTTAVFRMGTKFFFGTLRGLYVQEGQHSSPRWLGSLHPSLARRISAIIRATDGTLWVGTYGSGVVGYKDGKVTHVLNKDSGLTSNIIRTVCLANNVLWLGTDKGLNKVQWKTDRPEITRYTSADGLPSDMINTVLVDSNKVYVGTPGGLTCFEEDKVFTNSMCLLHILEIRSGRRRWISDSSTIRFGHYENDIRFEFTGISFKSAGEIEYRYQLKGLDSSWQTTQERFLHYPTLPSGSYVLQLQAVNKFGISSAMISIPFEVEYLLHERTWFRVMLVLAAAMGVWWYVTYRVRRIRRQEQMKTDTNRKMAELEQMALRAQMNPHFIFNSLNSIQHYVFDKDVEGANRFITAFSRLIRLTLELSTRARISLEEERNFLQSYLELEKKRFNNKFRYRIEIEQGIEPAMFHIPPMMLQPYVENSIRHGIRYREDNKGLVLVRFSKQGSYLECCIEDNGIGRTRSNELKGQTPIEYQSRGMTLTARRIEMMNKSFILPIDINISDIYADNRVAGTRVTICIPLQEVTKPTY